MMRRLLPAAAALLLVANAVYAHDFWLEPSTFRPAPGQLLSIGLRVGQGFIGDPIPRSTSLIESFVVREANGERPINGFENQDPAGVLHLVTNASALIGYRSKPYPLELTPEKYAEFLRQEGFDPVRAGNTTHREQFSRFAKAIVGTGPGARLDQPFGWRFEISPAGDPRSAGASRFHVVLDGKPFAAGLVTAINRDDPKAVMAQRTDGGGNVTLRLPKGGVWLIKCVALLPAPRSSGTEWETLWASLTFER